MTKICFYCDTLFSVGGVQRVLAVIAKALSPNYDITILTHDKPEQQDLKMYGLEEADIRYRYIRLPPLRPWEYPPCKAYSFIYKKKFIPQTPLTSKWYGYSSFPYTQRKRLINELNSQGYDLIIGVHAFLSLRLASIRRRLTAQRVIGWMHTSYNAFFNTPGFYLYEQKNQFRHEMPKLDGIIVLTHRDRERYEQELSLFPKSIYNPLSLTPEGAGNPSYKRFLSVGRMSHLTKGFDILIEAFALFARDNDDWTLEIVGEGPEEEALKEQVAKHKLENRITISPFTKQIQKHYASSSIYILSSRWEGFPLVLAEAMSHRLPIIASDLPVIKELLKEKANHLIFPNENAEELAKAMSKIIKLSSEQLNQMGETSLEISESLKLPAILHQWEKYIESGK